MIVSWLKVSEANLPEPTTPRSQRIGRRCHIEFGSKMTRVNSGLTTHCVTTSKFGDSSDGEVHVC